MAVTTPSVFTPMHDEELDKNSPSGEHGLLKVVRNNNFLGSLVPIGTVWTFQVNQLGVPPIDTTVWQLCDGSEITNPNSPLRSVGVDTKFTPNANERNIRCQDVGGGNAMAGTQTYPVGHNHTGLSTFITNGDQFFQSAQDKDGNQPTWYDHQHPVDEGLGNIVVDSPPWYKVAAYMKVA